MTSVIDVAVTAPPSTPRTAGAGMARSAAMVLVAVGIAHVCWASGLTWPARDAYTLSTALYGFAFAMPWWAHLAIAAISVAAAAAFARRQRAVVTFAVTVGALTRAALGLVWCVPTGPTRFGAFYWLNALVCMPVWALVGVSGVVVLARRGTRRSMAWGASLVVPLFVLTVVLYGAFGYVPHAQRDYRPAAMLGVESRYVQTPTARFHYVREGSGSPVVLLSPGSAWVVAWLAQLHALSATHTVYAVDLPGQGFTELADRRFRFDLASMTGAIGEFLDAVGLSKVALAGNSWSGGWALAYAQRNPTRVSSLVLLAPSGLDQPDPLTWEILKLPIVGRALTNVSVASRSVVAASVRSLFVNKARVTSAVIDAMWAPNTLPDNVRANYELEAGLDWSVTERALPATSQPTLIIWGRQDTVLPVSEAPVFADRMPDAHLEVFDGCGHAITWDCPDRVATTMTDFLRGR